MSSSASPTKATALPQTHAIPVLPSIRDLLGPLPWTTTATNITTTATHIATTATNIATAATTATSSSPPSSALHTPAATLEPDPMATQKRPVIRHAIPPIPPLENPSKAMDLSPPPNLLSRPQVHPLSAMTDLYPAKSLGMMSGSGVDLMSLQRNSDSAQIPSRSSSLGSANATEISLLQRPPLILTDPQPLHSSKRKMSETDGEIPKSLKHEPAQMKYCSIIPELGKPRSTGHESVKIISSNHGETLTDSDDGTGEFNPNTGKKRRGNLPKGATYVLKNWLGSHLSYPYPTDEEKQALMDQTSLSLGQINNWFINARRRILPALKSNAAYLQHAHSLPKQEFNTYNKVWSKTG